MLLDQAIPSLINRNPQRPEEIREFFNAVGPALRHENIFARGVRNSSIYPYNEEISINERVNNMSDQQFADHMNELFLRDNKNPITADVLS